MMTAAVLIWSFLSVFIPAVVVAAVLIRRGQRARRRHQEAQRIYKILLENYESSLREQVFAESPFLAYLKKKESK